MIIPWIFLAMVLVALGVLAVLVFTYLLSGKRTTPVRTLEELRELGLRTESVSDDGDVLARGTIEQRKVEVHLQRAPGGVPIPLLAVRVEFEDGGTGLRLRRQGTLDRYSGDTDLLVGDEEFDSRFIVDSGVPPALATWLSSPRRRLLIDHRSQFTRIEHRQLVLESSHWPRGGELVRTVGRIVELSLKLESAEDELPASGSGQPHDSGASGGSSAVGPAAVSSESGTGEPGPEEPGPEEPGPGEPEPEELGPGTEQPTGEETSLEEQPGALVSAEGTGDATTAEEAAYDEELTASPETSAAERSTAEEVDGTPMEALEPAALSFDLFAEGVPGFEASERFETSYRGREVSWTGTLSRVSSGEAELDLLALDPTAANPKLVRARCALSNGAEEGLRGSEGTAVTLRGTLAGCDPFLRILTLQDARPV